MKRHPKPQLGTNGNVIWYRVGAFFIDSILLGLIWVPIMFAGAALGEIGFLVFTVAGLVATLVYGFLLERPYGYTPGKFLLGLVVIKPDGSNCTIGVSILRNLLWVVDPFPTFNLVAMISILLTDDNQRVGDLVADTAVVKHK